MRKVHAFRIMSATVLATYTAVMAIVAMAATPASAQNYPAKPIRFIIPFPPGGSADLVARLVAPRMTEALGQPVVIDNRGGAGGTIGAEMGARAPADGYTLVMGSANIAVNVSLYGGRAIDPLKELAAVSLLATAPNLFTVHPSLPARNIKQLIALARAQPGRIYYASGGAGSTLHLATELFKAMAQVDLLHVPYKGTGPAMVATLSGEASVAVPPASAALSYVKNGRLHALAICSLKRFEGLPEVPTMNEAGVPGYEASQWYGVMAPAATPQDILSRLNRELLKIMQAPEMKARLAQDATLVIGSTPQEFTAYMKSEIAKWDKVVKFSGARVE
jgi:tripartite-type tricarboxylate transporter receptor subunit TctC